MAEGTLHERLEQQIEALENLAQMVRDAIGSSPWVVEYLPTTQRITNGRAFIIAETHVGSPLPGNKALWAPEPEHIAIFADPSTVLRGLAEDRDILRRHAPSTFVTLWERGDRCPQCTHGDPDGDEEFAVDAIRWDRCPEIQSLCRRLGIEAAE